jgi:hypothetical protein
MSGDRAMRIELTALQLVGAGACLARQVNFSKMESHGRARVSMKVDAAMAEIRAEWGALRRHRSYRGDELLVRHKSSITALEMFLTDMMPPFSWMAA